MDHPLKLKKQGRDLRTISAGVRAHVITDEIRIKVFGLSSSERESNSMAWFAFSISACASQTQA
jgi:hypothetical protein